MTKSNKTQTNIFTDTVDDLPLFSGTAQRASDEQYAPKAQSTDKQGELFSTNQSGDPYATHALITRDEYGTYRISFDLDRVIISSIYNIATHKTAMQIIDAWTNKAHDLFIKVAYTDMTGEGK